jgi:hypothetical protein
MIDQLIVVDYVEGAGGEFFANFLSAHFGSELDYNPQRNPNFLQKWINSQSLVVKNWDQEFKQHLIEFRDLCNTAEISRLAVPYHLYKWPHHIDIISETFPTRFVKINVAGYEHTVQSDFERKNWFRKMTKQDVGEVKFLLQRLDLDQQQTVLDLYRRQELTLKDLIGGDLCVGGPAPTQDIEIFYKDFFLDFDCTIDAYKKLCAELTIIPNFELLSKLIDRNKKNWQDLQSYLITCVTQ